MTRPTPLLMPCEGSGASAIHTICPMCGLVSTIPGCTIPDHERTDVLAMIERGDYE